VARLLDVLTGEVITVALPNPDGSSTPVKKRYEVIRKPFGSSRSLRQGYDPNGFLDEEVTVTLKEVAS
jgi:hypothetical protein